MDYSKTLNTLHDWAVERDDVRALILTGSGAAGTAHPLSDRDIEVFTTDVSALLQDESWWSELGEVLVVERLENGNDFPSRLIYYAGGKLDFTLLPARELQNRNYARPFQVLLDKDGDAATITPQGRPEFAHPTTAEFEESINWAWAAALMEAKAIVRDEPWSAKARDEDLKHELLRMVEWDHRARYGADFDTRYLGTRMRQWMDEDVQAKLSACWAGLDEDAAKEALLETVSLYRMLAERTATALQLPAFDHARVEAELTAILCIN